MIVLSVMIIKKKSDHEQKYSHPCRYGKGCRDINDIAHQQKYFHIEKPDCENGSACSNLEWKHREKYYHKGCCQFLIPCKYGVNCKWRFDNIAHLKEYKHV